jgi:hypothetical protein
MGGQQFFKSLANNNFAFIFTSVSTKNIKTIFRALECDMGASEGLNVTWMPTAD